MLALPVRRNDRHCRDLCVPKGGRSCRHKIDRTDEATVIGPVKASVIGQCIRGKTVIHADEDFILLMETQSRGDVHRERCIAGTEMLSAQDPVDIHFGVAVCTVKNQTGFRAFRQKAGREGCLIPALPDIVFAVFSGIPCVRNMNFVRVGQAVGRIPERKVPDAEMFLTECHGYAPFGCRDQKRTQWGVLFFGCYCLISSSPLRPSSISRRQ